MQIKGSNAEIQDPFPFVHVFIFLQWLQTRISICCPSAADRLTLAVGLGALLSQLRSAQMKRVCVDTQLPKMSTQLRQNWIRQQAAESILDDTQKLVFYLFETSEQIIKI